MLSNENKKQNLKRCELCAMPIMKNPKRHMDTYHADLPDKTFRRLQQGYPPSGDWKYCSNCSQFPNMGAMILDSINNQRISSK